METWVEAPSKQAALSALDRLITELEREIEASAA
jgi:hypothetical protein